MIGQDRTVKNCSEGSKKALLTKIKNRSKGYCCLCATLNEFKKLNRGEFLGIMKEMHKFICDKTLAPENIRAWKDEFKHIKHHMIPIIEKRKSSMKIDIVLEMRHPRNLMDVNNGESCYSDAILVSEDGYAVLEFKQRKDDVVKSHYKEAMKYVRRLHWHKIARHQKKRLTYFVCTKIKEDGINVHRNAKYGNSDSVARDLTKNFFPKSKPYKDIKEWISAETKQKKSKRKV